MFIDKEKDVIHNCRYCLMCRHTCTVASFTKNESDTPRAKALNLWTVLEKMRSYSLDDANIFFNCIDCNKCKEHCVSDYDVPAMVKAARRDLVEGDIIPEKVSEIRNDILTKGNPFGLSKSEPKKLETCNILLFPGCENSINSPEIISKAAGIIEKIEKNIGILNEECCGAPLKNLGFFDDARSIGEKFLSKIISTNTKELIVFCPSCFFMLTKGYQELGLEFPEELKIKLYIDYFFENISNGKIKVYSQNKKNIIIHDPCSTGRNLRLFDLPRKILNALGINPLELFLNKGEAPCCGGSVISRRVSPELGGYSANLILDETQGKDIEGIVTSCPSCRYHLKNQSTDIKIFDLIELI